MDITNSVAAGNIVTEGNANTALVSAFMSYSNNGGADVKNNVFLGTLTGNRPMVENWYNTNTRPSGNAHNYVTDALIGALLSREKSGDNPAVEHYVTEDYAYFYEAADLEDGTLLEKLNAAAGAGTFVMNDGMPMHKDVVDVYGRTDDSIGSMIPEGTLPEVPEVSEDETTDSEETTESDTESDTTTEVPADTTEKPVDTTTEEVGTTDEPSADVTTKPEDVTTAEPAGTTEPSGDDEKGCGSMIGASALILALAVAAPAALVLKKKDEE